MNASPSLRCTTVSRAFVCAIVLALPSTASAQVAVLIGRILDSTGAPIEGARIRAPQLERAAPVDADGRFRLDSVEQSFTLRLNSHVLASVDVRARARQRLPDKLAEFEIRRQRGTGRFMGPGDMTKFDGQPLTEALRTILTGARFDRNGDGRLTIISSRTLNVPTSLRPGENAKSCGVQIWQDGVLLSDPNASADLVMPSGSTSRRVITAHMGADKEYDISGLLSNSYMAVEYYSDLSMTPPGFRTGTQSCGVLVLWTRVPMPEGQ
jgi:hypothetical protein